MKKYEAGFIGAGNMGGALALAAMKKVGGDKVAVACSSEESTAAKAAKLGCAAARAEEITALRETLHPLRPPIHGRGGIGASSDDSCGCSLC